jgi:hypothetical protein
VKLGHALPFFSRSVRVFDAKDETKDGLGIFAVLCGAYIRNEMAAMLSRFVHLHD